MSKPLTIQIPDELEQELIHRATQLKLPLEAFILQSLHQLIQVEETDDTPKADKDEYEDESKESMLASLHVALQEVKDGKVRPIEELWDDLR
jgi:predicted transcriptional regulator